MKLLTVTNKNKTIITYITYHILYSLLPPTLPYKLPQHFLVRSFLAEVCHVYASRLFYLLSTIQGRVAAIQSACKRPGRHCSHGQTLSFCYSVHIIKSIWRTNGPSDYTDVSGWWGKLLYNVIMSCAIWIGLHINRLVIFKQCLVTCLKPLYKFLRVHLM